MAVSLKRIALWRGNIEDRPGTLAVYWVGLTRYRLSPLIC